MVAPVHVHT